MGCTHGLRRLSLIISGTFCCLGLLTHRPIFFLHRIGGLDVIRIQMGGTRMLLRDLPEAKSLAPCRSAESWRCTDLEERLVAVAGSENNCNHLIQELW
jgi:hypothetical protein